MSTETSPLNPEPTDHDDDSLSLSLLDSEINKKRDPLYILIFYAFSLAVSVGGFGCAVWGYIIVRNAPFDEYHKKSERESYEKYFYGMQSIWVLLGINILWTALNLRLAFKGLQNELWPLNMAYDVLLWATLIAFGVLNMIEALWDRRLCDGHWKDEEMYKKCDIAMFQLLVVELVSVNLGLLAAVLHFILLIGRCCTQGRRNDIERHRSLRTRILEEEDILLGLMERRAQLLEENSALEGRSIAERPLPNIPVDEGGNHEADDEEQRAEEDLIDMTANEGSPAGATRVDDEVDSEDAAPATVPANEPSPAPPAKST